MKVCYQALLDVYYEMEEKIGEAKSYRVKYAIEAVSTIYINLEYYDTLDETLTTMKRKKKKKNVDDYVENSVNVQTARCLR